MNLGDKILKLRKELGLSQEELAEKINVTRQTISNWELEITSPKKDQIILLSKELKVGVEELLGNDKSISKTTEKSYNSFIKYIGLFFSDIVVFLSFILLYSWFLVMVASSVSMFTVAICLIAKLDINGLIPYIPYWSGLILSISFILFSLFFILLGIEYLAFVTKILYSYLNMRRNILNKENIELSQKVLSILNSKKLNLIIKVLLIGFILMFMIAFISCVIASGHVSFWHTWNWWV